MRNFQTFALATAVAGSLDILSAFGFAALAGRTPLSVLTGVASGPFGNDVKAFGLWSSALGLVVHFTLMAVMVWVFLLLIRAMPALGARPLVTGVGYGLAIYAVMYWIVLPMRWPMVFPQTGLWDVGNALFSHIVCVGIPIAWICASALNARSPLNS